MAQNHIQRGEVMPYTNGGSSTITSGRLVVVGDMVGVALGDIEPGATGQLALGEVWELPKDAVAVAQGDQLYAMPDGTITTAADDGSGNAYTPAGKAFAAAADTAATVQVRLNA